MDERGQNKEDPSRDSQDEAYRGKLMAHENYSPPINCLEHDSGRTSRRHSQLQPKRLGCRQTGSGQLPAKVALSFRHRSPLCYLILCRKIRSRALSPKTPQSWTSSDPEEADPDSAAGNLTGAQRSLQDCAVSLHCSRRC